MCVYYVRQRYSRSLVNSANLHDTIGVYLERHFNLGYTTWRWRYASKFELAKVVVVFCHCALALEHLN